MFVFSLVGFDGFKKLTFNKDVFNIELRRNSLFVF